MGVKRFIWDEVSDNVLLETDETDAVTARYCQRPETFGELLFQDRSGTKSFFHYDGNASTCNLTDSSESVTDTTLYTAYGEEVSSSGSTTNPFGYKGAVGYYTNDSTADIYVRNRSYEPAIGRWLSTDPLGFIDGTSLYRAYFVPNYLDALGQMVEDNDPDHATIPGQLPFVDGMITCIRVYLSPWFVCTSSCPGVKGGHYILFNTGAFLIKTFTCLGWRRARRRGEGLMRTTPTMV